MSQTLAPQPFAYLCQSLHSGVSTLASQANCFHALPHTETKTQISNTPAAFELGSLMLMLGPLDVIFSSLGHFCCRNIPRPPPADSWVSLLIKEWKLPEDGIKIVSPPEPALPQLIHPTELPQGRHGGSPGDPRSCRRRRPTRPQPQRGPHQRHRKGHAERHRTKLWRRRR